MAWPRITEPTIRAGASPESFARGKEYFNNDAISNAAIQENTLTGDCEGTSAPYYRVRVELDEAGIRSANCSCPYEWGGYCKHVVALLLQYVHKPKDFAARESTKELLADLSREDLLVILTKLLERDADLYDLVQALIATPSGNKSKKDRKKSVDTDVYRRQVRSIMHSLDGMRASEAYWQVGGLANELRIVVENARKFLDAGDAQTALEILLILLEEVGNGIEYIDDSDGELGSFMDEIGEPIAEAILSLELSQVERARLIERLNKLSKHLGDYGVDGAIPIALQAAKYGWSDAPPESDDGDEWQDDEFDDDDSGYDSYAPEIDFTDVKLNILARRGKHDEFLALSKKGKKYLRYVLMLCDLQRVPDACRFAEKHLKTASEALALAEKLRELKQVDEAVAIAERGLDLAPPKAGLGSWLGPIQESRGEGTRAFDAWFAAFAEVPSLDIYARLKRLGAARWQKARARVMSALKKSGNDQVQAEVHLFEEEWDDAIKIADGRNVWYQVQATVADAVVEHRPEWVIRVSIKQAEELIGHTQSKYYAHAAEWLARAKKAYTQLEQGHEWREFLERLKEKYKRRHALQEYLRHL